MSINPIEVARLSENQREQIIRGALQALMGMSQDQAFQTLRSIISTLASQATDQEYVNWCLTTMRVLASFPDEAVRAGLALRARVVASLDKRLADRDRDIVNRVMGMLDEATRQKLMRNMQ